MPSRASLQTLAFTNPITRIAEVGSPSAASGAVAILSLLALLVAGCGTTEESGEVGETLSAEGLEVTVERVDTAVPVPRNDVTGLSTPGPGTKLIGARVRVCSEHGGAIGPFSFGVETSSGDSGEL
jgi:hypothetical protein